MTQFTTVFRVLLLAPLCAGVASAQVETPASPSACGKPSYVLQVGSGRDRTPLTVKLNSKAIDLGKPYQAASKNVSASVTDQNRIQVDWTPKQLSDAGRMYGVPVTLKMLYGSRATTLFQFDPKNYPNQRQVAVKFAAPPPNNLACDKNLYTVKLGYSNAFGPFEWTIAVDGKYYAYILGDGDVNLRPFLKKGANKVTLGWRVIGGSGTNNLGKNKVAQVISTVDGKTSNLLTFGFKNTVGSSGSKSVTITVP
ncbi:hypothetical protein [Deinococcus sp. AJ005]|uniref:hypothetical protein n=1 Tax=Deinococcus sp. AJ005 TaxID=2652443 RepID=UPI00125CD2C6|nr:hypothetical protein [Deinococcus sp. AJ005]QFP77954.1 hypothetical protein DAAJ005_17000 [Deinococcus sp. AJ005]